MAGPIRGCESRDGYSAGSFTQRDKQSATADTKSGADRSEDARNASTKLRDIHSGVKRTSGTDRIEQ